MAKAPSLVSTFALAIAVLCTAVWAGQDSGADMIERAQRIVFLGDSITWDGRYVADFDAWLTLRHPKNPIEIINAGLPSETVSGLSEPGHANGEFPRPYLHERLARALEKTKPDLVFACYGMNCAIYQPFDNERFEKYRDGITRLHDEVAKSGAQIIFLTPPAYDVTRAPHGLAEYNDVLGKYGDWVLSMRAKGWNVIDVHGPMSAELAKRKAVQPDFTFEQDGIHPDDAGHWFITRQIIRYCGDEKSASAASIQVVLGESATLLPLVQERMTIRRDAWLAYIGHKRPGMPAGLSIDQATMKANDLTLQIQKLLAVEHAN